MIAQHLPGCTGLAAGDVGRGAPAMASTASCTLEGHIVIVDSFASPAEIDGLAELSKGHEMYYASGTTGWLAFLADQGATPATTTLQEQLTNDAGALLKDSIKGDRFPAAPIAAQKTLTTLIAKQLGGAVGHVS